MATLSNFRLERETQQMQHATVFVTSWWRTKRRPIYREHWSQYWKFTDTGEFLPERVTSAFRAQSDLQKTSGADQQEGVR